MAPDVNPTATARLESRWKQPPPAARLLTLVLSAWLATASGLALAAAPAPVGTELTLGGGKAGEIAWVTELDQALEQAAMLRRPVMVDIWAQWCRWCHELDRRTYSQAPVIERAEGMTCAKVNADREPQIGRQYGIRGLPTILFLDRHGKEIDRVTGFVQATPFAAAMDAVVAMADPLLARMEEWQEDRENPALIYAFADELMAHGSIAEAEPLLASLTPAGPHAGSSHEADAVLDLAIVRTERGDLAGAREILDRFMAAYPASPRRIEAGLRRGHVLLILGEIQAARTQLESVAESAGEETWKAAEARRLLAVNDRLADSTGP